MNRFDQIIHQMTDGKGAEGDQGYAHLVTMLYMLSRLFVAGAIQYKAQSGQCLWDEFVLQLRDLHPYYANKIAQMYIGGVVSRPLS